MTWLSALDLGLCAVFAVRRIGWSRSILIGLLVAPIYLWSLPPIGCGCFRPLFRRCDDTVRYQAQMRSDLKNLASQLEIFRMEEERYSVDFEEIGFWPSDGVSIELVASPAGWTATARHVVVPELSCTLSTVEPVDGAAPVGAIDCRRG